MARMTKTLHGRFSQRLPFNRCAGIAVTTMTSTQLKTDARIFTASLREIPADNTLKNLACILLPLDHMAHFVCLGAEMTSAKNSSALKFYSVNTSINCLRMLRDDALSLVPTKRSWQMNRFSECAWSEPPVQVLDIVSRNTRPSVLLNVENADSSARVTENQRQKLSGKTSWRRNGEREGRDARIAEGGVVNCTPAEFASIGDRQIVVITSIENTEGVRAATADLRHKASRGA